MTTILVIGEVIADFLPEKDASDRFACVFGISGFNPTSGEAGCLGPDAVDMTDNALLSALRFAVKAAAVICESVGCDPPRRADVRAAATPLQA